MGSKRLPGKMLLPLGGKPLVAWAYGAAVKAFGWPNVVVAIPATQENDALHGALLGLGAEVFRWDGPEADVLGRFYACAHRYRWHPDTVIVRISPDDPFKDPVMLRLVAAGERLAVEVGGEAFTLAQLDAAHFREDSPERREHITYALFPSVLPAPDVEGFALTVDTAEDYAAARALVGDA